MKKAYLLLLVLIMLVTGCVGQVGQATPTSTTPTTQPKATSTLEPTATQSPIARFEEGPCAFNVPEGADMACGHVIVPEDHAQPSGPTIRLAVVVIRDHSENHQPDPVILLAGGPGEKIVENAQNALGLFAHIHPNRDLIIFDQRGVGLSEPALECPDWAQVQYDLLDEEDPLAAMETSFDSLMTCRDQLVSEGHNLSAYNTTQSAADVNAIRLALGYDQLNVFGGSYGSFLAQAVAREYPDIVRSMVINSVWPLEESFFVAAPIVTSDAALRLLAACEMDEDCDQAYPDLEQVFFDVIERLNGEPVTITVTHAVTGKQYGVLLTGDRVYSNLVGFLYLTQFIPLLPEAIYDVYNGDYELMAQLQGTYLALYEATSRGMLFSVVCAEDLIGQEPEELLQNYDTLPDALKGAVDPEQALDYGIFAICEQWPVEEHDPTFKEPLISDVPTLILEGEFDPVTPMVFAEKVAANLSNSYLYEFPGVGHNITVATDCSRRMIGDFIADPSRAPETSCISDLGAGFLIPYEDPAGLYTIPIPSNWIVREDEESTVITSSDEKITVIVVVVESENFTESAETAWAIVDPDFEGEPNVIERPCIGCAAAEADKFALIPYDTDDENAFVLGASWIYDGMTYVTLWRTDQATIEEKGSQVDTILMGFTIHALEEVKTTTPPPETSETLEITLVPFTSETFGIAGVIPEGWSEASPGLYARGDSASDVAVLLLQAAPTSAEELLTTLAGQLGLQASPDSTGERRANDISWKLYFVDVQGITRDIALAEIEGTALVVILRCEADERDALYESVFLPAVDALLPEG